VVSFSFKYTLQKYLAFHSMNTVHKKLSAFATLTHIHLAVFIHLHTILIEALDHIDLALKKCRINWYFFSSGMMVILKDMILLVRQNYAMWKCHGVLVYCEA